MIGSQRFGKEREGTEGRHQSTHSWLRRTLKLFPSADNPGDGQKPASRKLGKVEGR